MPYSRYFSRRRFLSGVTLGALASLLPDIGHAQSTTDEGIALWQATAAQYPDEVKKAKAAGIVLSVRDLQPPLPPDSENAALIYRKMLDAHGPPDAERLLYEFGSRRISTPAQVKAAQKAMAQCAPLLKLVHEATALPKCVYPDRVYDITSIHYENFSEQAQAREAIRFLRAESLLMAHAGKSVQAVQNLGAGFAVARQMASDNTMIGFLVGRAVEDMTLSGLWLILYVNNDAPTAEAVAQVIAEKHRRLPLGPLLSEQAASQLDWLNLARKSGIVPFFKDMAVSDSADNKEKAVTTFSKEMQTAIAAQQNVLLDANAVIILREMRTLKEAAELPYPEARPVFAAFQERKRRLPDLPEAQRAMQVFSLLPDLDFLLVLDNRERGTARAHTYRAGAAVMAYRATHGGTLPATLEAALSPVPIDPYSGKPLLYRLEGSGKDAGFVVYSVGPNGDFDGGQPGQKINPRNAGCAFRFPFPP